MSAAQPHTSLDVSQVIKAILKLTNNGKHPTTYRDLANELGAGSPRSAELSKALDCVQWVCSKCGYPSLAVMVGHSGDEKKMPGDGFFISYFKHYFEDSSFRSVVVESERQKVRSTSDWDALLTKHVERT